MMPPKVKAICNTLAASIQSGLNATLTPDDCRELLRAVLTAANPPRSIQPSKAAPKTKVHLDRLVDGIADIAAGLVEEFAAEMNAGHNVRRKKD
jgi:hypothetical protein